KPPATGPMEVTGMVMVLMGGERGNSDVYEVSVLLPLMTKTWLVPLPRNKGFGPVGTTPTAVSPATSMWKVAPLAPAVGFVDKTTVCAKARGSPVGLGTGTINCRNVSLQPANRATDMAVHNTSHSFLRVEIITAPPESHRMNELTWDFCERLLYRVSSSSG